MLTVPQRDELVKMYLAKVPVLQICLQLNIHEPTIYRVLAEEGILTRRERNRMQSAQERESGPSVEVRDMIPAAGGVRTERLGDGGAARARGRILVPDLGEAMKALIIKEWNQGYNAKQISRRNPDVSYEKVRKVLHAARRALIPDSLRGEAWDKLKKAVIRDFYSKELDLVGICAKYGITMQVLYTALKGETEFEGAGLAGQNRVGPQEALIEEVLLRLRGMVASGSADGSALQLPLLPPE